MPTTPQVGGAIRTALLSTLAAGAASDLVGRTAPPGVAAQAQLGKDVGAFGRSAVVSAAGAVVVGFLLRRGPSEAAPAGHVATVRAPAGRRRCPELRRPAAVARRIVGRRRPVGP